jgi:putative heme-binding domain-containing protein
MNFGRLNIYSYFHQLFRFAPSPAAGLVVALVAIISLSSHLGEAKAADRTPWSTSRVTGSPEAPPPFQVERAFPSLKFTSPVDMAFAPGSDRIFVAEQGGKVRSFVPAADVTTTDLAIDLRQTVTNWKAVPRSTGFDSLLGIAFHPRFAENHYVYLCYTLAFPKRPLEPVGTRVSRFTMVGEPPRIDPTSEKQLLQWQAGGHNGGCLKFDKDGFLYISAGDQADPNPPDMYNTGQDISDLRAGIMRIDVDHTEGDKPYAIPKSNPFINHPGARGEVWCYGLRNPWRFSFDRATGNLWVADVGWELWESIYCAKAGGNYGWSIMEGPNPVHADGKRGPTPISPPLLSLSHAESASITGGFVYRGTKLPSLVGQYIFGDWETRRIWAAKLVGDDKLEPHRTLAQTDLRIVGFGEDPQGELYVIDYEGGGLYTLARNPAANEPSTFPRRLSQSGLFVDLADQKPAPGVVGFTINAPQWVDGANAQRFVAVPGTGAVQWKTNDVYGRPALDFPKDSVLVRTLSMEMTAGAPSSARKIETQLLHFDGKRWAGYSYRWREDQSDADLVPDAGDQQQLTIADASVPSGKREQTWHFSSRAQCMTCHTAWSGFTLAFNHPQFDLQHDGKGQLAALFDAKLIPAAKPSKDKTPPTRLVDPYNTALDLNDRARSYLNVNCATCHREGGGGSALIDLRAEKTLPQTRAFDQPPMLGAFGIDNPRILCPGDPSRSVLLYRASKTGSGRMPHIASDRVDDRAVALLAQWIESFKSDAQAPGNEDPFNPGALIQALKNSQSPQETSKAIETLFSTTRGGLALDSALETGEIRAPLREQVIARGLASSLPAVRDLFFHFSGNDPAQIPHLGANFDRAKLLAIPADPRRGRDIFQNVAQCGACHIAPGVTGRAFGPDLTHIATKYTPDQLLQQIAEPSKTIADGFTAYTLETTEGDSITGFIVSLSPTEIAIKDATLEVQKIPTAQIKSLKPQALSIMPQGLLDNLAPQDAADLLKWLSSLK